MKLNPFDSERFMAHAHDFAIFSPRRDLQAIRKALAFNHERVIARRKERIWQIMKQPRVVVKNRGSLAVHDPPRTNDFTAESLSYALMAEANAQYGNLAVVVVDQW